MCVTAVVEAQLYQTSAQQLNHDAFNKIANDLIQMHKDHAYCRESIQAVLQKLLRNVNPTQHGAKLLDRIAQEVIIPDYKAFVYSHADNLGFYLAMRAVHLERFVGQLREHEHVYENEVLGSDSAFKKIAKIASQGTYLHPRLHSSMHLLVADIYRGESGKERNAKVTQLLTQVVLGHFCSSVVY